MTVETQPLLKGGEFLIRSSQPEDIFTPEDLTEEHGMIAETTQRYVDEEVSPRIEEIENQELQVTKDLLEKSGKPRVALHGGF